MTPTSAALATRRTLLAARPSPLVSFFSRLAPQASCLALLAAALAASAADQPIPVTLAKNDGNWQLLRDGRPWLVQGAGGGTALELLAKIGGNTERTWGIGKDTRAYLDEAQRRGLAVVVGIWLGHERHGFDWSDQATVAKQLAEAQAAVIAFKDHPALLAWGLGNEMEGYKDGGDEAIWRGIEDVAKMVHAKDPGHPTLTTVAEIGGQRVPLIHRLCPDIDIVGINTYGGAPSLPERYRKAGGTKPYLVTEYGPPGTWEVPRNAIGAVDEPTSTAKGAFYRATWESLRKDHELCLGAIAFTWGAKVEATATWFGMLTAEGARLEAADQLGAAWTGAAPANRCPQIQPLTLAGPQLVKPGALVEVALAVSDPENDPLTARWTVVQEQPEYDTAGEAAPEPVPIPEAVLRGDGKGALLRMPEGGGIYRATVLVRDDHGGAALANATLRVDGPALPPRARKLELPAVVYAKGESPHWAPSGYMGDHDAVTMDPTCTEQPRASGGTCLKVSFAKAGGWGGTVWQNPANDWGKLPGGFDLSGSTRLTFWARGHDGGEQVKLGVGMIDTTTRFYDTTKKDLAVTLTTVWTQYTIELGDRDLARIKSGFWWTVGGKDKPVVFYLDDIRYE
jgi:hypothetical protein